MSQPLRIGIIGGSGWLGGAFAEAIVTKGIAAAEHLTLSYRRTRPSRLAAALWTSDNQALVDRSDVIFVSVRPGDWPGLAVKAPGKLVISVMAGITIEALEAGLKTNRVVRSLPNAAAEVGWSYTPWVPSTGVTEEDRELVSRLFASCGVGEEVPGEAELDYLTGFSGTGPAFPALLAAAMVKDAVSRGIQPEIAGRAVDALLIGAGRLLEKNAVPAAETVEVFKAYRGTTAAAIEAMLGAGFDAAVAAGLQAALNRTIDMGRPA